MNDMIYGAALLGAGGGGSITQGLKIIKEIIDSGRKVVIADLSEVSDEELAVVSAGMGSPLAAKYGWRNEHLPAFDLLEKFLGRKINYVVPIEIGAGNVAVPVHTAAFKDRILIDGDGAGRAIPELELTTFDIYGVPISPMSISDWEGNGAILFTKDAVTAEKISRNITVAFEGVAGIALYLMSGVMARNVIIPGTLTFSTNIGKILRTCREKGIEPVEVLRRELNAYVLGSGKVINKVMKTVGGFDIGLVEVAEERGSKLRVHLKNENIIAERDGRVLAMAPDLVCWLSKDGTPLTNTDIEVGMSVWVIGFKAHEKLRTDKALKAFEHLYADVGFKMKYVPIEELISSLE
ncbi:MAG: DUF917 domain-containing protein [Zestosphaera sp.]